MALTWGSGIDEEQLSAAGINPSDPNAWLQYQKRMGAVPEWVSNRDDFEADQAGWIRTASGWQDKGVNSRPDYLQAYEQMAKAMEPLRAQYMAEDPDGGYQKWVQALQTAEGQLKQSMGVQQTSKAPIESLGFSRRARAERAGGAAFFDNYLTSMKAPDGWAPSGNGLSDRIDDYMALDEGSTGAYSRDRLEHLRSFGNWIDQQPRQDRATASRAYADWDKAWSAGNMKDDWQTYVGNAVNASSPVTAPAAAAPEPPPVAVTQQPGYQVNGNLQQAYRPRGLLGAAMR